MYSDINNNIGFLTVGKSPIRKTGHSGMLPVIGVKFYFIIGWNI
jgi:hypothetical protein